MFAENSSGIIVGCRFIGNRTNNRGGNALGLDEGGWTIHDTVIVGNRLHGMRADSSYGGGIYLKGNHTLRNVLVAYNEAGSTGDQRGGGVYVASGSVTLDNVTIVGNYPDGLYNHNGVVTLRNSILWRNQGVDIVGTVATLEYNLISDGTSDGIGGNFAGAPVFEFPLLYLTTNSPAIARGNVAAVTAGVAGRTSFTNGVTYANPETDMVNLGYHFPEGIDWDLDLYVSTAGNDANDGSGPEPEHALRTLNKALELAAPRTRIHIAAGNYLTEPSTLTIESNKTIQFLGTNTASTVIDFGRNRKGMRFRKSIGDNRVEGLTIANGKGPVRYRNGGALLAYGSAVRLRDVRLADSCTNDGKGAGVFAWASGLLFEHCKVSDNEADSHSGGGFYLRGGCVTFRDGIIARNLNDVRGGTASDGVGMYLWAVDLEVINSLFIENKVHLTDPDPGGGAIRVHDDVSRVRLENCVFVGNYPDAIKAGADTSARVYNSVFWNNDPDDFVGGMGEEMFVHCFSTQFIAEAQGNIIAGDPLFVDADANNYRLKTEYGRHDGTKWVFDGETSILIDAGTNMAWMAAATDLDGRARQARGNPASLEIIVDIGAYEMHPMPRGTLIFIR